MGEISEAIQSKCLAFSDRIIKLNDEPEKVKKVVVKVRSYYYS